MRAAGQRHQSEDHHRVFITPFSQHAAEHASDYVMVRKSGVTGRTLIVYDWFFVSCFRACRFQRAMRSISGTH
jgi:hypothetical protein